MVRSLVAFFAVCCSASILAQGPIKVSSPTAVDVRVSDVNWNSKGSSLIYRKEEDYGFALGTYQVGKREGKTVLHLPRESEYSIAWFASGEKALISATTKESKANALVQIYLIDARQNRARKLFSESFSEKNCPRVSIDMSPLLQHAVLTLDDDQHLRYLVAPDDREELIPSPDLERLANASEIGPNPNWTIAGTAVFTQLKTTVDAAGRKLTITEGGKTHEFQWIPTPKGVMTTRALRLETQNVVYTVLGSVIKIMSFPNEGSTVMELIPTNGVLRPIRLRGSWLYNSAANSMIEPKSQPGLLTFEKNVEQVNSLWLKLGSGEKGSAAFLAAKAADSWIADSDTAVAYIVDGALFVRQIQK